MAWTALTGLFGVSFLAATVLPAQSELVLAGLLADGRIDPWLLVAVASLGNTLGAVVNWGLGRGVERLRRLPGMGVSERAYRRAEDWFRRFGAWTLLLSWAPFFGDALTVAAGALRTPFVLFLVLVAIGKTARYAVMVPFLG
ncbi:YqaA family protein [Arenibaculum pallidiluteum]|uniref:YqaA family protein n=1 Tax=Arenibaculum pallidiluteum TaxID=2812559 RepID=UPI001A978804|nr:YqaA family protein [Arenibaculum pallidiluteum]